MRSAFAQVSQPSKASREPCRRLGNSEPEAREPAVESTHTTQHVSHNQASARAPTCLGARQSGPCLEMIGDRKTNIFGKLVRQKVVFFEEVGSHVFVFTLVLNAGDLLHGKVVGGRAHRGGSRAGEEIAVGGKGEASYLAWAEPPDRGCGLAE